MPEQTNRRVTVIIPVYGDWDRLTLCLGALARQTLSANDFNVVVANNDPAAPPPDDLPLEPNTQVISAPEPGSYAARNAGLAYAETEIVAFTDADCIPEPDWLENALAVLDADQSIDLIAGKISLFWQGAKPTAVERCDSLFFLQQDDYADAGFGATANVITRRNVFDAIGIFDATLMSGGDKEWTKRATRAGHKLVFGPNVVVKHPARGSLVEMLRKSKRIAGGVVARKRAERSGWILPQFDRILPSLRVARKIYAQPGIGLWEGVKVWCVFHRLKWAILAEQIRLVWPGAHYKR